MVQNVVSALADATEKLVEKPSKDALKAAIDAAKELKEENYTPETWAPFTEALKAAEEVLANEEATAEMVQKAKDALVDATGKLVEVAPEPEKPSKDALKVAIDAANALTKEDYTEETWAPFADALKAAEKVYADEEATVEDVEKAVTDLQEAQNNLVEVIKGWHETENGLEYYENGKKVTGWKAISEEWYYFNENGIMQTGWVSVEGHWYYLNENGTMATGWVFVNGHYYYMDQWGAMCTGWVSVNGHWYYMDQWGAMMTGWVSVNGHWYYMDQWGAMVTGWVLVGNDWYYMNEDGTMATSKWIDGYYVDASGKMA